SAVLKEPRRRLPEIPSTRRVESLGMGDDLDVEPGGVAAAPGDPIDSLVRRRAANKGVERERIVLAVATVIIADLAFASTILDVMPEPRAPPPLDCGRRRERVVQPASFDDPRDRPR
ncbi:MAG: hypothetical protein KF894_25085, partial [Labilithrix sp.]|nr:hypothetical protein [Labilithrix sp.]